MIGRLLAVVAVLALVGCAEEVLPPRGMPPPPSELSDAAYEDAASQSGVPQLPVVLTRAQPEYPDEARRAGVQGTVWINTLVRADGSHRVAKVIASIPQLDHAARECLEKWQFKPGTLNGRPIELWVAVPVEFVLQGAR